MMSPRPLAALLLGLLASSCGGGADEPKGPPTYVGAATCATCHAREHEDWRGSHHDLAMQEATDETVLGDFDDVTYEGSALSARFFRRDGAFLVETMGANGEPEEYEVSYVFGVTPLQQVLLRFPGGRDQCFTVAWDTEQQRWFELYPDQSFEADDPLHWTGRYQRWNAMCAVCHSTNLDEGYSVADDTYSTTWSELDVACEACHGPGEHHVTWADGKRVGTQLTPADMGLTVPLRAEAQAAQMNACAPCHSRRTPITHMPAPGTPFLDAFVPALLREGLYHADGQILDEVYVWGSFVQSKMHAEGVTCTDCHDPHSLEPVVDLDALCSQCHSIDAPVERFPTLQKKNYYTAVHHFHEVGTEGARCVSCHMPTRTYMQVDPRRDHSFRVPRPDLSVKLGTPNACNACHADQSSEWAAERVREWYGDKPDRPAHFAESFAAARLGDPSSFAGLVAAVSDEAQAAIVRATALELLQPFGQNALPVFAEALEDEEPLVRLGALQGLDSIPANIRAALLPYYLQDPVRAVRIEVARLLASVPRDSIPADSRDAFDAALAEFVAAQERSADMPGAHLNLARLREDLGQRRRAEDSYRKAIELDPFFLPARFNLTNLLNGERRNDQAERVLREGIERVPEEGELHFSLALLLGEMQRVEEAARAMGEAARLMPGRARVHYNHGLMLQMLERRAEAETALLRAHELDASDPDFVNALAILHFQSERWELARDFALKLEALVPESPGPRQMLEEIERKSREGTRD